MVAIATVALPLSFAGPASAQPPGTTSAPACAAPGSIECPTFERHVNHKFGFSVDVPSFFVKTAGDADQHEPGAVHISS